MTLLCGGDFRCLPDTESGCPSRDQHTPMPRGYVDRAEWIGAMVRAGSVQQRCPECRLYVIITPRARSLPKHFTDATTEDGTR